MQAAVPVSTGPLQYQFAEARNPRPRASRAVYRRRRLAVLFCTAALFAIAWQGLHQLSGLAGDGPLTVAGQPDGVMLVTQARVIVQPGDTLWTIARRVQPEGDVRPLVGQLDRARDGRALQVGETIVLPTSR